MKKKLLLSLLLGGFFMWLAARNVDFAAVGKGLSQVNLLYVLLTIPVLISLMVLRAWRLMVIAKPLKPIRFASLFPLNAVGFMAILTLPLRLGELVRPYLLKKSEGLGFTSGLAVIAVERVFDGLSLVAFFLVSLFLVGSASASLSIAGTQISFLSLAYITCAAFVPPFIFLWLLILKRDLAERLIGWLARILPKRAGQFVVKSMSRFIDGLKTLPNPLACLYIFGISIMVWLVNSLFLYITFLACGIELGILYALPVQAIICIGIGLPAGPAFIGNYQLFTVAALGFFGIDKSEAFTLSIVNHFLSLAVLIPLGAIFLPRYNLSFSRATAEELSAAEEGNGD